MKMPLLLLTLIAPVAHCDFFLPGQASSTQLLFVNGRFELVGLNSEQQRSDSDERSDGTNGEHDSGEQDRVWRDRRGRTLASAGDLVWMSYAELASKLPGSYFIRRVREVGSSAPGCSRAQSGKTATHCSGGAAQARTHRGDDGKLYVHEWDELKADDSVPGTYVVFAHFAELTTPSGGEARPVYSQNNFYIKPK